MLTRRDWPIVLAALFVAVAGFGVDWRLGFLLIGLALAGFWHWFEDVEDTNAPH